MDSYSKTDLNPSRIEHIDFSSDCSFIYQQLNEKGILSRSSILKNRLLLFIGLFAVTVVEDVFHSNEVASLWFFKTECFNYFSSSFENCLITQVCKNTAKKRLVSCYGTKLECYEQFKAILPSPDVTDTTSTVFIRTDYSFVENYKLSTSFNICTSLQQQQYFSLTHYLGQVIGFLLCSVLADRFGRKKTLMLFSMGILVFEACVFPFESVLVVESLVLKVGISFTRGFSIHSTKHLMTVLFLETNPDVNSPYIDYFQIIYFIRLSAIMVYCYVYFTLPFSTIYLLLFGSLVSFCSLGRYFMLESPRFFTERRDYPGLIEELKKLCVDKKDSVKISLEYVENKDLQLKNDLEKEELRSKIKQIFSVSFILEALTSIEFGKYSIGLKLLVWTTFESIYYFTRMRLLVAYFSGETFRFDLMLIEVLLSYVFVYIGSFIIQQFGGRKILAVCLFVFTALQVFFQIERLRDGDTFYFNFERKAKRNRKAQNWNYLLLLQMYLVIVCKQVFEMETIINVPSLYRCTIVAFYKCISFIILINHSLSWFVVEGDEDLSVIFALFGIFCIFLFSLNVEKEQLFELNLVENKALIMNYTRNNLLLSIKRRYLDRDSSEKETKKE